MKKCIKLKKPVRDANGKLRTCKLPKKTTAGRKADRKTTSKEYHEKRYACEKKGKKLKSGRCVRK